MRTSDLQEMLDYYVEKYNTPDFIADDPISIPHQFSKKQDQEISAFFAATFAWGQRKTIINKTRELMHLMDDAPHDFVVNFKPKDLKRFEHFVHRTFQYIDTLYFMTFLQQHYRHSDSLETLFIGEGGDASSYKEQLIHFQESFFQLPDAPRRTQKHVATPARKSTCKRINMFLRWMVRKDSKGVDFGIWSKISPADLHIPLDVHVDKVARRLGLLRRKQNDWKAVEELTGHLKQFDPEDPARYDFALFGLGILEPKLLEKEIELRS